MASPTSAVCFVLLTTDNPSALSEERILPERTSAWSLRDAQRPEATITTAVVPGSWARRREAVECEALYR